jgi:hypothetical protein
MVRIWRTEDYEVLYNKTFRVNILKQLGWFLKGSKTSWWSNMAYTTLIMNMLEAVLVLPIQ